MFVPLLVVVVALSLVFSSLASYPEPPPTFDAKSYTTWEILRSEGSKRGLIRVDFDEGDFVQMYRLDLVGDAKTRGFAHGSLMTKEILEFTGPALNKYYRDMVLDIDISQFPEPIHSVLRALQVYGAAKAPEVFKKAMAWVWESEKSFVPQYILDEIDGMAEGICHTLNKVPNTNCDVAKWAEDIRELNMLPEVIRMACTAYGAWGKATPDGGLVQLRALDFGGGPFANYTVITTHRGDPNNDQAFVSVSFPGFVGVITGVSQKGVGVSEKVWMTYDTRSLQPGSYVGLADIFVLRHILQYSKSRAEAEDFMQNVARTWGMWVGVGDYTTGVFDLVAYKQESIQVLTDVTAPSMTGQPYLENVAYVDKHPQPTHDGATGSLPTALTYYWGNITTATSKAIIQAHQTGDLHIASYDFKHNEMLVAIGRTNKDGEYHPDGASDNSQWKAYNRPYIKFNLRDLWLGV